MTCKKAQEFLAHKKIKVTQIVDAKKIRIGPTQAMELILKAKKLIAFKGKKTCIFDFAKDKPSKEDILKLIIGPSGNLRAPTARMGNTYIVGFSTDDYLTLI